MSKIIELKNRAQRTVNVRNQSATKAEIILYAEIGKDWWGDGSYVSAKDFSDQLDALSPTVNEITLRINSAGGDVFDGITIYNRLRQHKAKKIVYIDGLAASIASVIMLAGDEIHIGEGAMVMVHLPWTMTWGNRMDLDNVINRLMDVEEQMLGIYSRRTGLERSELRAMCEAETYLDADQAIKKGFVDSKVEDSLPIAASLFDREWINKKPKNLRSETSFVSAEIDKLKKKIGDRLARK